MKKALVANSATSIFSSLSSEAKIKAVAHACASFCIVKKAFKAVVS